MRTAIAIIAVLIGMASAGYAWYLHSQPRLPYTEPHHTFERDGEECVAWRAGQFVIVACEGRIGVLYPDKPCYSS